MKINPSIAKGIMISPPSKSMAHRNLICAALADGTSIIHNIDFSEDIKATISCLESLGVKIQVTSDDDNATSTSGTTLTVFGTGGNFTAQPHSLFCNESGSTLRFFIPIAMLSDQEAVFTGSQTLLSRPLSVYEDICAKQGIAFEHVEGNQSYKQLKLQGKLQPGNFEIPGNISSQFITGLLFVLPLLSSDSTITLTNSIESRAYIDMTIQTQKSFGVKIEWQNENTLFISGNQYYKPGEQTVEGDFSNAAFFEALNTIGGSVTVQGLNMHSLQGDKVYLTHFEELKKGFVQIDISDCPDLGPILFVVAALHHGGKFTGTKRLKIKESDRGTVMCEEFAKLGIATRQSENEIEISPLQDKSTRPVTLLGHNDHRIVMALTVLLTKVGGNIEGIEAVRKSLPDFFVRIRKLGIDFEPDGEEIKNGLDY
ncbi:MAG: 3-phosphoshikimate 1-carboxyvinyltransferase [Treponema sp.]|nr:3-phosphoshikimate 1-carboxyvinyltransferase [Treponema sp.]